MVTEAKITPLPTPDVSAYEDMLREAQSLMLRVRAVLPSMLFDVPLVSESLLAKRGMAAVGRETLGDRNRTAGGRRPPDMRPDAGRPSNGRGGSSDRQSPASSDDGATSGAASAPAGIPSSAGHSPAPTSPTRPGRTSHADTVGARAGTRRRATRHGTTPTQLTNSPRGARTLPRLAPEDVPWPVAARGNRLYLDWTALPTSWGRSFKGETVKSLKALLRECEKCHVAFPDVEILRATISEAESWMNRSATIRRNQSPDQPRLLNDLIQQVRVWIALQTPRPPPPPHPYLSTRTHLLPACLRLTPRAARPAVPPSHASFPPAPQAQVIPVDLSQEVKLVEEKLQRAEEWVGKVRAPRAVMCGRKAVPHAPLNPVRLCVAALVARLARSENWCPNARPVGVGEAAAAAAAGAAEARA